MRLVSRMGLLGLLGLMSACGGEKTPATTQSPAVNPSPAVAPAPSAPTGSIEGVVVMADGMVLPQLGDPLKASKLVVTNPPAPCTPIADDDVRPVKQDAASGGLSSIHIALTGMASTAPVEPRTHELRLENCRLNQALLGARIGDRLRITNASSAPLLPSMLGDSFMEAILANQSRTIDLKRVGASRISCSFGAYCGQTDVLVTSHSLFAVTDASGRYRIDNVPLDRELTIHAWHPLFEESNAKLTLTKDASKGTMKLVLRPVPTPVPPAPVPSESKAKVRKPKVDRILVQ